MSIDTDLDIDQRLADLRPQPYWPDDERAALLEAVLRSEPTPQPADRRLGLSAPSRRGRRAAWAAAAAGLAAAACFAVSAVLPAGSPGSADRAQAAEALHQLARVAGTTPAENVGPGQYVHLVDVTTQAASSGQPADRSRYEYWIRSDGQTYQKRTEGRDGTEVWLNRPGPVMLDGMTAPVYLDQLPTEPQALEAYVQAHTTGSNSAEERVFVAVADIVRRAVAGPELRSAAIDVLAGLEHVQLTDTTHDSMGNPVRAFDFDDETSRPDEVRIIMFDTRTAQITEERDYLHGHLFGSTTVPVFEIVDSVPANIRDAAVLQD